MTSIAGTLLSDWASDWRALASRHRWLAPAVPALIAALLGAFDIGTKSMWLDEAFSVNAARLPTLDLLSFLPRGELHATPYYLTLHGWLALGSGEAVVRSLSVVFGVVAVVATYFVGQRYHVGFAAALILSVSPFFIQFEQEARQYTLLVAWSAIATLAFLRLTEQPSRLRALVYGLIAAAMIYIQPLGALVIVAHGLWLPWTPAAARRLLVATYAVVAVAWLPMVIFAVRHRDRIGWISPLTPSGTADYLVLLGGGLLAAVVLAILLVVGIRRDVVTLWLLVPIVGAILISVLIQPTMQARYLISVLPAAAIIAARARPAAIAVLVAVSLVGVGSWYVDGTKDDWREGVAWVESQAQPTDGIIFSPSYMRQPFEYYGEIGVPLYPSVPWDGIYVSSMGNVIAPPAEAGTDRVWVVEGFGPQAPAQVMSLVEGYEAVTSARFGELGPWIKLMVRQ